MKAHIGADAESGLVYTVRGTSGQVSSHVIMRPGKCKTLNKQDVADALIDRLKSSKRECAPGSSIRFQVVKPRFGYAPMRYRRVKKTLRSFHTACAVQSLKSTQQTDGCRGISAPENSASACMRRKMPRTAVKTTLFLKISREIPSLESVRLTTRNHNQLFRPSFVKVMRRHELIEGARPGFGTRQSSTSDRKRAIVEYIGYSISTSIKHQ